MANGMNLGPYRELSKDDIEYFRNTKHFELNGVVESPYFVFNHDTKLVIVRKRFEFKKYLKAVLAGKFSLKNGHVIEHDVKTFHGVNVLEKSDTPEELDTAQSLQALQDALIGRPKAKSYVAVPAREDYYDALIGQVSEDGAIIELGYKVKFLNDDPVIIRGATLDLNCQTVNVKRLGSLKHFIKEQKNG